MYINIGVQNTAAPLQLDLDITADELIAKINSSLETNVPLKLTGSDGSLIFVPAQALAYVKINKEEPRHVGFAVA